jgi:WD40 repeat protein/uncharacterized caspase-like protein
MRTKVELDYFTMGKLVRGAAWILLLAWGTDSYGQDTSNAEDLPPDKFVERTLRGGEAHSYRISLEAGQFLRVLVEQRGINVVMVLYAPDGTPLAGRNRPNGLEGEESLAVGITLTGTYDLEVRALEKDAAPGQYVIRREAPRQATTQDWQRSAAEMLFQDGLRRHESKTVEGLTEASQRYEGAITLWHDLGDSYAEGSALMVLGWAYEELKQNEKAIEAARKALDIHRGRNDRAAEGADLFQLGRLLRALDKTDEAANYFEGAVRALAEGDKRQGAINAASQALEIYRARKDRKAEGEILFRLGNLQRDEGHANEAASAYEQVARIRQELNDCSGAVEAYRKAGEMFYRWGAVANWSREDVLALKILQRALPLFRTAGDQAKEADTLNLIGRVYFAQGEKKRAAEYYRQALTLFRAVEDEAGEARAQANLNPMMTPPGGAELIVQKGHIAGVTTVAVSPDGKLLASGSEDNTVKIWDIATGSEVLTLYGHYAGIYSVAFSPDGKTLASGSRDGTVRLWELASGQELRTLEVEVGENSPKVFPIVSAVAFSPDGRTLLSGTQYMWREQKEKDNGGTTISEYSIGVIDAWDVISGVKVREFKTGSRIVVALSFSPDGRTFACLSGLGGLFYSHDNSITLWDVVDGRRPLTFADATDVQSIAFSPDGALLAGGCIGPERDVKNNAIKLWEVATGKQVRRIKSTASVVNSVAFSHDGKLLAGGSSSDGLNLWNVTTGQQLGVLKDYVGGVNSVAFSPDGKFLYGSCDDYALRQWDVASGRVAGQFAGNSYWVNAVALSPDGRIIASGGTDRTIKLWDASKGQITRRLVGHKDLIFALAFSHDGKILASAGFDEIKLWDVATGKELQTFAAGDRAMAFSPDGKTLASGDSGGHITLLDVATGKKTRELVGHYVERKRATVDDETASRLKNRESQYDPREAQNGLARVQVFRAMLAGQTEGVSSLAFSPDGHTLASGSEDKTVKLWDVATGQELKTLRGHAANVEAVAFSPDGQFLASGSWDHTVKLWNVTTGQELKMLAGHTGDVDTVAFSPDGKMLASGGKDTDIILWDVTTGQQLPSPWGHDFPVRSVTFSPDGKKLVSGGWDTKVIIWDTSNGQELGSLVDLNENDWAVVTPDGRFDASAGAFKLMHYSYGLDVISFEQLKEAYYEPGLLSKLLGFSSDVLRVIVPLREARLPPQILEQRIGPGSTKLFLRLKNLGGGIGPIQVFVNGKRIVADAREAKLRENPDVAEAVLTVDLKDSAYFRGKMCDEEGNCKANTVTVIAGNYLADIGRSNINSRGADIVWEVAGNKDFSLPTLYAIVVGVSDYDGDKIDLRFAAKDAEDFGGTLGLAARRLFCPTDRPVCLDKVQIKLLSTSGKPGTLMPTKANFEQALAEVARKAKPEDILVIYLAGHGITLDANTDTYFFLTQEASTTSREDLTRAYRRVAISSTELTDWLTQTEWQPGQKGIKALKQVLILDTCAAGKAGAQLALSTKRDLSSDQVRAIEFLKDKAGVHILMGSTADQPSYEASQYGQGLLTYALLEGMSGRALQNIEYVDVQTLFRYTERRVPQLATNIGGIQQPVNTSPTGKSFVIGQMTESDQKQVPLAHVKPVILRPLLSSGEEGDDPLNLVVALRKRLDAESSYEIARRQGRNEPLLVYVDDDSFPHAVRITGTYLLEGDRVRIKTFLRRDGKTLMTLPEIASSKDEAVDNMMAAILDVLRACPDFCVTDKR